MTISEKTKQIYNKTEQSKDQYNLNRQAAKISSISWVNLSKHEFLTNKEVLQENKLVRKRCCIGKIWKFTIRSTSVTEKQYQGFNNIFKSDEKEELVTINKENSELTDKSNLMYDNNIVLVNAEMTENIVIFFSIKYDRLRSFYHWLNDFRNFLEQ